MAENDNIQDPTGGDPGQGVIEDSPPSGPETPPDSAAEPREKDGFQKRIDKLTREKYEAIRQAEYFKGLAEGSALKKPSEESRGSIPELKPENFGSYDEYVNAVAERKVEERVRQEMARIDQNQRDENRQKIEANIKKQYAAARKKYDDFDEKLQSGWPFNETMHQAAIGDNYAEIVHYLSNNHDEAFRINILPPLEAAREIGKIEARILSGAKQKPDLTHAPETFDQISSGGAPTTTKSIEKMSRAERFAQWEKERLEKGGVK